MKAIFSAATVAVVLFTGAVAQARANKQGPVTTFSQFSSVDTNGGCFNADPTTDCTHSGVGTAGGVIGGSAGWTAWATLPEPGAVPITDNGNSFASGYGFVTFKVARGARALDITARLTVHDELTTSFQGTGFGTSQGDVSLFPGGCSREDCAVKFSKTLTSSPATGVPASMAKGSGVTLTQTIAAPEGQTLREGNAMLRVTVYQIAGGRQTPGNAGTAAGTLKLDSITVTRR